MRGGRVVAVALLFFSACESAVLPDAAIDAASPDADPSDAGVLIIALSATMDDLAVHLAWVAARDPLAWDIVRNGQVIASLGSGERSFDDGFATSGSLGAFDASASIGVPSGIEIDWTTPPATPGPAQEYEVRAQLPGRVVSSNRIDAGCDAPRVVRWLVTRGDAGWSLAADAEFLVDPTAPSPIVNVTELVSRAVPDDRTTSVAVIADASVSYVPQVVSYTVSAQPSAGPAPSAVAVSGSRGGDRVAFQWQRSIDDSPNAFIDLQYVHGRTWADLEAPMSEGRYYRVVARSGAQQWFSTPTRAFLVRPAALVSTFLVRDDGFALQLDPPYNDPPKTTQFDAPNVRQYFAVDDAPCALYVDGGSVCFDRFANVHVPLGFPATRLVLGLGNLRAGVGGYACSADVRDGSVDCAPWASVDADGLVDVTAVGRSHVCGHLTDAGIRCAPRDGGPIVDLGSSADDVTAIWPFDGVWLSRANGAVELFDSGQALSLPVEDAGYTTPVFADGPIACGIREDGYVRCPRPWPGPYVSREPMEAFLPATAGAQATFGLTRTHRLRSFGEHAESQSLPTPPIRALDVFGVGGSFLGEDGRIAGVSYTSIPFTEFGDLFSAVSTAGQRLLLLRTDGVLRVEGATPAGGDRFQAVGRRSALLVDGGLVHFLDTWTDGGAFVELRKVSCASECARRADRSWVCSNGAVFPADAVQLAGEVSSYCWVDLRGRARCNVALPEPLASMRFQTVRGSTVFDFITVEGVGYSYDPSSGTVVEFSEWDDLVECERIANALTYLLRRDKTALSLRSRWLPWADK